MKIWTGSISCTCYMAQPMVSPASELYSSMWCVLFSFWLRCSVQGAARILRCHLWCDTSSFFTWRLRCGRFRVECSISFVLRSGSEKVVHARGHANVVGRDHHEIDLIADFPCRRRLWVSVADCCEVQWCCNCYRVLYWSVEPCDKHGVNILLLTAP